MSSEFSTYQVSNPGRVVLFQEQPIAIVLTAYKRTSGFFLKISGDFFWFQIFIDEIM